MEQNLKDQIVYITGASAGIGEAIAHRLAKAQARLVLIARRKDKLLKLQESLISKYETECHLITADVRDTKQMQKQIDALDINLQAPDILINNAGLALGLDKVWEISSEDADSMINTNIKGVLNTLRLIVPRMLEKKSGHILNLSSVSAYNTYSGGGVYCSTKFALRSLSDTLRLELMNTPIRVSMLSPGLTETEFSVVRFKGDSEKADNVYSGIEALTAEDIAASAYFILSQPKHVAVSDLIIHPTNQANSYSIHRE
ncbi:MAG: SDR family NAD(P)-dependent oxidoreductase [Chlamydiales bacterium]|nr:SDR family NAD(P)-dependent oxidoreductase [Chlamydiales bacterium]